MNRLLIDHSKMILPLRMVCVALVLLLGISFAWPNGKAIADCSPSTSYGTDTINVTVPLDGNYYPWLRMISQDGTNNQIMLSVDGGPCNTLGTSMPANSWTWVNTLSGGSNRLSMSLTAGPHTLVFTGNEQNVGLDEVQLLSDPSCTPSGLTNNCTGTVSPPALTGDLNNDGHVNLADLSIFLTHWQQQGTGIPEDFDHNNIVNLFDLSQLLTNYGA